MSETIQQQHEQEQEQQEHVHPFDGVDLLCIFLAAALPWFIPIALAQYFVRRSETVRADLEDLAGWARGQKLLPPPKTGAEGTPAGAQGAEGAMSAPTRAQGAEGAQNGAQRAEGADLLTVLGGGLHVLVIGHTRGGKTTLIHELAQRWARAGRRVLVCDPDAAPGLWAGCRVAGAGDDMEGIGRALDSVRGLVARRREQRASGRRQFAPLYVVLDEAHDIMHQVDGARDLYETLLRRGGKLGIHLVVGVQDRQVGTLKLEGASHLLINFGHVVHVRYVDGRRVADVETSEGTQRMPVPVLPDLDTLITPREGEQDELLQSLLDVAGMQNTGAHPPRTPPVPPVRGTYQGTEACTPVQGGVHGSAYQGGTLSDEDIRQMKKEGYSNAAIKKRLTGTNQARTRRLRAALGE
jgi:hypothetical protein